MKVLALLTLGCLLKARWIVDVLNVAIAMTVSTVRPRRMSLMWLCTTYVVAVLILDVHVLNCHSIGVNCLHIV
jgi:hypothetical protein